jgi:hypothetical protein
MVIQTLGLVLVRRAGALFLGGVILWQVAEHCGATNGQVIIHVTMPQVHVAVDGATFWVENFGESPIVCDLRSGRHQVRMMRNGQVLYQEEFTLREGEERILTAWDGYSDGRSPGLADGGR